ncbi:MAG: D-alanine--D-alanine ligase [Paludibacter sp.]|nr:MAG: D-alanine--D-alanine ligase [Paludibacter sp.]
MQKRTVAIIAGGNSSEREVSFKSANGIKSFINSDKYDTFIVSIVGKKWEVKLSQEQSVVIDKNDFSFTLDNKKRVFDFAFITIHGTPGENGILQGYFELLEIPYSTCNVLTSSLTFNKFFCNNYLRGFGVKVPDSILVKDKNQIKAKDIVEKVGLPCFIKPNAGGSSFGTTKVKTEEMILSAIDLAHKEGDEVIIEKLVKGKEFTCGIYKTKEKTVIFPITEIVTKNEFFDYGAKYNNESEEITPARISYELTNRIKRLTEAIYDILDCKGIVRADYIISEKEEITLLEVNTTPGMTSTSFIPQQVKASGLEIEEVMSDIIEDHF